MVSVASRRVVLDSIRPRVAERGSYVRIVVPIEHDEEAAWLLRTALDLAAEHRASLTTLHVIEMSADLPLDADMTTEEIESNQLLRQAVALANERGVHVNLRTVRARDPGSTIVNEAERSHADLIVIGSGRENGGTARSGRVLGETAASVLRQARCRVLLAARPRSQKS